MITEWTRPREPSRCLSDLALDQMAAGEDPGALHGEARRAHLRQCALCESRRLALQADAGALLARRPALGLGGDGQPPIRPSGRRWLAGALASGAVAAVIVMGATRKPAPSLRTKGGIGLDLFVKRGDGRVEALLPDAPVSAGDALRFRVSSDGAAGVVALVGVDAAGAVQAYDPTPGAFPALSAGERRLLDGSIVLDGSLGRERVLAFVCSDRNQAAAAVDEVRRALPAAGAGPPPVMVPGCRQADFRFRKVLPP